MAVLGLITCEALALEFAFLLRHDAEVAGITVVEDARSEGLVSALESGPPLTCIPHVAAFRPDPHLNLEVLIRVLDMSLHARRRLLHQVVSSTARELNHHIGALVLGYGQCGGAFSRERGPVDVDVPVFFAQDGERPMDDCVCTMLGGRARYRAELAAEPGTFFMTPEWTLLWPRTFEPQACGTDSRLVRRVFKGYKRTLLVVTPAMSEADMRRNVSDWSNDLELPVVSCEGTLRPLAEAMAGAKNVLARASKRGVVL